MKYLFVIFLGFSIAMYAARDEAVSHNSASNISTATDSLSVDCGTAVHFIDTDFVYSRLRNTAVSGDLRSICMRELTRLVPKAGEYIDNQRD
ncbi:MAG: hypothetical protein LBC98_07300 [Prevotellaceae bacterium]|jgi:hypothetical protein|nr:hypothetical protein [Prevotellaceae bacterium]